jgi:FAD synthase
MDFFTEFNNLNIERSWCTVGSFDGVHLGHQALIKQLVEGRARFTKPGNCNHFFSPSGSFLWTLQSGL